MEIQLTDSNFDEELKKATTPVLVDFFAEWCGPCKMLAPTLSEIATEYQDKLLVAKLDVDHNPAIAQKFGVMSIPTLIFFKNNQPVKQLVGYQDKASLIKVINEITI